jgi:hypothetical protein
MTWIKLDDQAVDHPKIASLPDRAFRWWVRGLSYASRFLTLRQAGLKIVKVGGAGGGGA